jgi:hypothetical protein
LGYAGVEAYQAENWPLASEKLEKAFAVLKAPSLGLWSARALAKQGKLVEAADRYLEVARLTIMGGDAEVQRKAQADAQTELTATQQQIPSVVIEVRGGDPAALQLLIDGTNVSSQLIGEAAPLNPGRHIVEGTLDGVRVTSEVMLAAGEQKPVVLDFAAGQVTPSTKPVPVPTQPPPDQPTAKGPSTRRTLGWVMLGGGAAGLVVGGVVGGMAISKRSTLDENPACADDRDCPKSMSDDVDSLNRFRTISTIGLITGGTLAAAGVVLLVTAPRPSHASASLWLSPTGVGLSGRFQ